MESDSRTCSWRALDFGTNNNASPSLSLSSLHPDEGIERRGQVVRRAGAVGEEAVLREDDSFKSY
jgi:hypothetical protein